MNAPIERLKEIVLSLTGLLEARNSEIARLKKRVTALSSAQPEPPELVSPELKSQGPDTDKPDPSKPETWRI